MKKIMLLMMGILVMFSCFKTAVAQDITKQRAAELLVQSMGMQNQLPDNYAELSKEESYSVTAGILAGLGITCFANGSANDILTGADLAYEGITGFEGSITEAQFLKNAVPAFTADIPVAYQEPDEKGVGQGKGRGAERGSAQGDNWVNFDPVERGNPYNNPSSPS